MLVELLLPLPLSHRLGPVLLVLSMKDTFGGGSFMVQKVAVTSPIPVFYRSKGTSEQEDNGTGVLHQVTQHPIGLVYLQGTHTPLHPPRHTCPSLPTQDLEGQGTGFREGRLVHLSKPSTPCSEGQLQHLGQKKINK